MNETKLKQIKRTILKKKIMLGFVIDNYSVWDRAFRYTHLFLAVSTPIVVTIQGTVSESNPTAAIVLSFVVAAMVKIKEYVVYDKIRDTAKEQTVKYTQLYERIEQGEAKQEADFIYWITRELHNIELNDPDLSHGEKQKFLLLCKEKGIPYDDDVAALVQLSNPGQLTTEQCEPDIPQPKEHLVLSIVSPPDEQQKTEFKKTVSNVDVRSDVKWTIERLNELV